MITKLDSTSLPNPNSTTPTYEAVYQALERKFKELASIVEERSPSNRFGMRVFYHSKRVAEDAVKFAHNHQMTARDIELLRLGAFGSDLGRVIAELSYSERLKFIPEKARDDSWRNDRRAQHRHGELSVYAIRQFRFLNDLPIEDINIIEDIIWHHATFPLELARESRSYKFCIISADLDRADILNRTEYTQAEGALAQFIQWGAGINDLSKGAIEEAMTTLPNLKLSTIKYLDGIFAPLNRLANHREAMESACGNSAETRAIVSALVSWFSSPVNSEILARLSDWNDGRTTTPPAVLKNAMTDEAIHSYANYMLAHILLVAQLSSHKERTFMMTQPPLQARLDYLRFVIGEDSYRAIIEPTCRKIAIFQSVVL